MKISFKRPEDVLPSALILLSIAILTGTLIFMLLAPPLPTGESVAKSHVLARMNMKKQTKTLTAEAAKEENEAKTRLWQGDSETIATTILGGLTAQANVLSLKVAAFRPERTILLDGLVEMPFNVQVSGPYPKVRQVIASFDRATSKVALRSAQISSSAASASNDVTATLLISAYVPEQTELASARTVTITTGGAHGHS